MQECSWVVREQEKTTQKSDKERQQFPKLREPEMRKEPGNTHLEFTLLHFLHTQPGSPLIKFNKKPKCQEVHWFNLYWPTSKGREKKEEEKKKQIMIYLSRKTAMKHTIHKYTFTLIYFYTMIFFVSRNLSISAQINFLF